MELSFEKPKETLQYFTSDNIDYAELSENAEYMQQKLSNLHTNAEGKTFQAITQCILECIRRLYDFKSTVWVSEKKLNNELLENQPVISFNRINSKGEVFEYKIINFDQIDITKELVRTELYTQNKKQKKNNEVENFKDESDVDYTKVLTLLRNGENVFLTGYAGTGKSYILNKLKEYFKKKLTITSTTGIAAVNIKGQTLHSWAGVGLCKNPIHKTIEKIRSRGSVLKQILNCKILAIDEISMLNIETFEYIDLVLKSIRDSLEPFGGIQVLFIGDFFQLPPVEIRKMQYEEDLSDEILNSPKYCFESPLWADFNLKNVVLKKNYRQSEEKFIKALSDMRTNNLSQDDIKLLETRETNIDTYETDILHIFSTNEEAKRYNLAKFNMIDEPVKIFKSIDGVYRGKNPVYDNFTDNEKWILDIFTKNCRAEKEIALKLGSRVMLLINQDFNKGLINGSCGCIKEFDENSILVEFDNGVTVPIQRHTFEYYYHDKLAAERIQYPIKLAYGITIHKSQGMTLDKLVVDCSRIFEKGQAYVAMSRVKTLDGLFLKDFSKNKVLVDEKVVDFYSGLTEVGDVELLEQTLFNIEEQDVPEISDEEAEKVIIECVTAFSGLYGKTGIAKILAGSKSLKDNGYNSSVINSHFTGLLRSRTQKDIIKIIEKLTEKGVFETKLVSFGRPILCIKKQLL